MRTQRYAVRPPGGSRTTTTIRALVAVIAVVASLLSAAPATASPSDVESQIGGGIVKAAPVVGFNAENIISDVLFYDGYAMSAAQIQSFLDAKIGACQNGKCLNVLTAGISSRDAVYSQTTGNLICSAIQGGTMRVSELIYRVQVACGISAKVILVTLQKEQGLTTSKAPSDWNLKAAMGASCPDTAPCDPAFAGVGPQILKGTQQLKTYKAARFGKQPGVNYIGYSPNGSCGGTNLNIANYATAALYSYTPYQPNAAALAAGYGLGDGCSSYGNRNFYNYYTAWFGQTQYPQTDTPFYDVSTQSTSPSYSVFAKEIVWMAASGISAGWTVAPGVREYAPTRAVSRDVMAAFLYRLSGSPDYTPPAVSPFADVSPGDAFYKEINWVTSTGIAEGWQQDGGTSYRPSEPVTRDVMAAFLYRLAGEPAFRAPAASPFVDVPAGSEFSVAIAWLASVGVSTGWVTDAGAEFRPGAVVTRDVMAAFLHRTFAYLNPFTDVSSVASSASHSVFAADIAWIASSGVSEGWPRADGTKEYRPLSSVSRDVMAAFLYRLAGSPEFTAPAVSPFVDVRVGQPFYKEISWLAAEGISEGWLVSGSLREFRPSAPVTRDVMAAFLYRYAGEPEFTAPSVSPFSDVSTGAPFYTEMSWMASAGVSRGWTVGAGSEYRPGVDVARDVMASFLNRLGRALAD